MKKLSIVFMVAVLSLFLMAGCSEEKKEGAVDSVCSRLFNLSNT